MNTINLSRREELCRSLNMDFDEAAELFSDETLESMQMAKVNGGGIWKVVGKILLDTAGSTAVGGIFTTVYSWFSDDGEADPTAPIVTDDKGKQWLKGTTIQVDSMKVINGKVYYWLSGQVGPTIAAGSSDTNGPTHGGGGRSF